MCDPFWINPLTPFLFEKHISTGKTKSVKNLAVNKPSEPTTRG